MTGDANRDTRIMEQAAAWLNDANDMLYGRGAHAGHHQQQAGRCVYCSCGLRVQGRLPARSQQSDVRSHERDREMKGKGNMANDPWAEAPEVSAPTPFITRTRKAALVNSRATVQVTGAEYVNDGQFGPKFTMTCVHPDGDEFRISFSSNSGKSPRDQINKWLWQRIRKDGKPIPAVLCKRGNAYFLDKPGAESDQDNVPAETYSDSAYEPEW